MKNNHKSNFCSTIKTTIAIRMLKIYQFCIGSVIQCYDFYYDVICVARLILIFKVLRSSGLQRKSVRIP